MVLFIFLLHPHRDLSILFPSIHHFPSNKYFLDLQWLKAQTFRRKDRIPSLRAYLILKEEAKKVHRCLRYRLWMTYQMIGSILRNVTVETGQRSLIRQLLSVLLRLVGALSSFQTTRVRKEELLGTKRFCSQPQFRSTLLRTSTAKKCSGRLSVCLVLRLIFFSALSMIS